MRMTLSAIRRFLLDLERESLFPDDGLQEDRDRAGEGEPEVFEHAADSSLSCGSILMVVVGMLAICASYACRLFRLYIVCTVSCGFPPIIHVRWCHALAVTAADAIQAFAELAGEQPIIVGFAESVGERDEPLEPVQVGLQVFR